MNNPDGIVCEFEELPKYEPPPAYKHKEDNGESQTIISQPPPAHLSQEHGDGTRGV